MRAATLALILLALPLLANAADCVEVVDGVVQCDDGASFLDLGDGDWLQTDGDEGFDPPLHDDEGEEDAPPAFGRTCFTIVEGVWRCE